MFLNLFGEKLEITSKKFEADEKGGIAKFLGNVIVLKGSDKIEANEVVIIFSNNKDNKEPIKYEAKGRVKFLIKIDTKEYVGASEYAIYEPKKKEYLLIGNADITETTTGKRIFANKIFLNELNGKAEIFGDEDKPAKFIFTIKENEK